MLLRRLFSRNKFQNTVSDIIISNETSESTSNSKLEYLPNELLFLVFNYLYCHEILYAFHQLNMRFQLLLQSFSFYHLNLSSKTLKSKFQLVEQLPLDIQNVKSLILSENFYCSIHLNTFLTVYPMEVFYSTLQSFSLIDDDNDRTISLLYKLRNFHQLKSFSISNRNFKLINSKILVEIHHIILFEVKSLTHFSWNISRSFCENINEIFHSEKSTIEHYEFYSLRFDELEWLNLHTKSMRSISIIYPLFTCVLHRTQTFENLILLKLNDINSIDRINYVVQHLNTLIHLKQLEIVGQLEYEDNFINGYKWEQFIEKSIPYLKILKFFFILNPLITSDKLNRLIKSFSTEFWLVKKNWFITCDCQALFGKTYLYTIPCIKSKLEYTDSWIQISTRTSKQTDIKNIQQLSLSSLKAELILPFNRLNNVHSLVLTQIDPNVTYKQLNTIVNMAEIKEINFNGEIDLRLLEDILKYHHADLAIEIDYNDVEEIFSIGKTELFQYFRNIKSLKLRDICGMALKRRNDICHYFLHVEELIITGSIDLSELKYFFQQLKHLSFLMIDGVIQEKKGSKNLEQWLLKQQETQVHLSWKTTNDIFCIFIAT